MKAPEDAVLIVAIMAGSVMPLAVSRENQRELGLKVGELEAGDHSEVVAWASIARIAAAEVNLPKKWGWYVILRDGWRVVAPHDLFDMACRSEGPWICLADRRPLERA